MPLLLKQKSHQQNVAQLFGFSALVSLNFQKTLKKNSKHWLSHFKTWQRKTKPPGSWWRPINHLFLEHVRRRSNMQMSSRAFSVSTVTLLGMADCLLTATDDSKDLVQSCKSKGSNLVAFWNNTYLAAFYCIYFFIFRCQNVSSNVRRVCASVCTCLAGQL